jgi:hypothetical protein
MTMEALDEFLEEQIAQPTKRGRLPSANCRGTSSYDGNELVVELRVESNLIVDTGFEVRGDRVLVGCASFLLRNSIGQTTEWGMCARAHLLGWFVRLPKDDLRVLATIEAFVGAVSDYRRQHRAVPEETWTNRGGAPRGHRKTTKLPPPTKADLEMLRPGETYEELMRERDQILGVLQNLDGCTNLGPNVHSMREERSSAVREEIMCLAADVKKVLPLLTDRDHRIISLIGNQGLTEREAAESLGLSRSSVHERLRRVACVIQSACRRLPESS